MLNLLSLFFQRPWRLCGKNVDSPSVLFCFVTAVFLCLWHNQVEGHLSLRAIGVYVGLCMLYMLYGQIAVCRAPFLPWNQAGLPLRFLFGFFVFNTLLFLLSIAAASSIVVNVTLLAIVGLAALFLMKTPPETASPKEHLLPAFLCLMVCGIAATFWCSESFKPPQQEGTLFLFRVWPDAFFHAREISLFAHADGLRNVSSPQMAGVAAPVYHYAIYSSPAAVAALGNWNAFDVFLDFMLPFGIILMGLAAYSLTASIWGAWPGLCGAAGLLLFPDAYHQGFGNKLLSFFFLQLVSPGLMFGVACAALCWIALLEGCRTGSFKPVFLAYALLAVSLTYRAHIFVANAYLVLIYPCLFFTKYRAPWRILVAGLFTALFWGLTQATRHIDSIPTLHLNGKSAPFYLQTLSLSCEPGFTQSLLVSLRTFHPHSTIWTFLLLATMVFFWVFGVWGVLLLSSPFWLRARPWVAAHFFPFLVLINFLIMSVGLEVDKKKVGMPEELLHRPFVWAYFVVIAWVAAGLYASFFGNKPPGSRSGRYAMGFLGVVLLFLPVFMSRNAQTMPAWPTAATFQVLNVVSHDLVDASYYIRDHSHPNDIVLDSDGDPNFEVSALSECQDFVVQNRTSEFRAPKGLDQRQAEVVAFEKMQSTADVEEFARKNKIHWFVLDPDCSLSWPESLLRNPVFERGGFRVYSLSPDNPTSN